MTEAPDAAEAAAVDAAAAARRRCARRATSASAARLRALRVRSYSQNSRICFEHQQTFSYDLCVGVLCSMYMQHGCMLGSVYVCIFLLLSETYVVRCYASSTSPSRGPGQRRDYFGELFLLEAYVFALHTHSHTHARREAFLVVALGLAASRM